MAAYLPPCDTETLMSDIGPTKVLVPPPSVLRLPSTAVLMDKNGNGSSPLKVFVQAKRSINDIFREMSEYAAECGQFVSSVPREHDDLVGDKARNTLQSFQAKVKGIHALLQRNHMKVTFFGRTSNGKSSVINAMLGSKILPSGIGHTTNCFLQVAASDREGAYLKVAETNEIRDVTSVDRLGHALCEEKLGESSIVQIYWPAEKCPLLKDDVVFVDSPGIDVSPNLDEWIDQHCLDADVFVLVSNAESTLMVTEKNFFHKVSEKLSKPNIFILNNRWDASASEPQMMEQVRQQHFQRATDFLVRELQVCSPAQAEDRVFFVSAKEVLGARTAEAQGQQAQTAALGAGFAQRYFEFQDFEKKFQECISKSAVKTKFEHHAKGAQSMTSEITTTLDLIQERAQHNRSTRLVNKRELSDKLDFTNKQLHILTAEMKDKICHLVEDVERKVSIALNEEIRKLSDLVDEFSAPFHPEPIVLNVYKRELHVHVESGLGSNLKSRLSSALAVNVESAQREMAERMSQLLPTDKREIKSVLAPRREPFEMFYRLNCDNLCADFKEDISFRFSFGFTSLIQRFLGKERSKKLTMFGFSEPVPRPLSLGHMQEDDDVDRRSVRSPVSLSEEDWSLLSRFALSQVASSSQGTVGGALIAGMAFRFVGWRVLAVVGGVYAALYCYERLTYTNAAKERRFKKQYVNHASKKLRLIVDLTSANCSHQVQQELSTTFARLCTMIDDCTSEMKGEIRGLDEEAALFEDVARRAKVLKNKGVYLSGEVGQFEEKYLKD